MSLLSIGLSHHTAPLEIREQVAVPDEKLDEALARLIDVNGVDEASIVSTCNRTEIYCHTAEPNFEPVKSWFLDYQKLSAPELEPYIYTLPDEQAVRHAFRVAAGLDSMVLGEPQILGQMKTAFATAHRSGRTGKILNRLFQQTFSVAKQVRTDTAIASSPVSVAYAAVSLAKQIFADISEQTVLMIGAGDTIRLAGQHLQQHGVKRCIIANRSLDRAQQLADELGAQAIMLDEIFTRLPEADIIISSTASSLPILGKGAVESALKKRKKRRMFLVDLAVPRDIEPQIAELPNVYLYTVDNLRDVINDNMQNRQQAAVDAEKIVDQQTLTFMQWLNQLEYVPTIRALRDYTQALTDQELTKALRRLDTGEDPDAVLRQFAHALSQKFMHDPSAALNSTEDQRLKAAVMKLFNLDKS